MCYQRSIPGISAGPQFSMFAAILTDYLDTTHSHKGMLMTQSYWLATHLLNPWGLRASFLLIKPFTTTNKDLVFNESKAQQLFFRRFKNEVSCPPNIQIVVSTKHLGVWPIIRISKIVYVCWSATKYVNWHHFWLYAHVIKFPSL